MIRTLLCILTLLFVVACGGGSSSNEPNTPEPPPQSVVPQLSFTSNINEQTGSVNEGDTVTFSANVLNTTQPATFTWQQTFGPPVELIVSPDGSEITFVAPNIFQVDSQIIELQVNAVVGGIDSGSYGASINIINEKNFIDFGSENSTLILGTAESTLQLMNVVQTIVEMQVFKNKDISLCNYDSVETLDLIDNDQDSNLSTGDTLKFSLEQCSLLALSAQGYGRISIDIVEYDETNQRLEMLVDFSRFFINDFSQEFSIDGMLNMVIDESNNQLTQTVSNNQAVQFKSNEQTFATLNESAITRIFDYNNAQFSVLINARMLDFSGSEELTVTQIQPFSGDINEGPNSGQLQVSNSLDSFTLEATIPAVESEFIFEGNGTELEWYWFNYLEGTLFNYLDTNYWQNNGNQGFKLVGLVRSVFNNEENTAFQFLFNRKLDPRSDELIEFNNQIIPFDSINLIAETQGAILNITQPESVFLESGGKYFMRGYNVVSENLQTTPISSYSISTQTDVIPIIKGTSIAYRENDYPTVNASNTLVNTGEIESYEWFEVTNFGVVFDTPNAETTSISIPDNIIADVKVGLKVTNNQGVVGEARQSLSYIPLGTNYVLLDSGPNEYIGQGQQWVIVDDNSFVLRFAEFYENAIDLRINNDDFFFMNIAPKAGEVLSVGVYEDANRFPFQDTNKEGFDFSGAGRGCNRLTANFDILEFTVLDGEIQSLAVDFIQYCENFDTPLKGKVRINSNLNIN